MNTPNKVNYSDHLDDYLQRIMHEDIKEDDLDKLIKISEPIINISKLKLEQQKIHIEQTKILTNMLGSDTNLSEGLRNQLEKQFIQQPLIK